MKIPAIVYVFIFIGSTATAQNSFPDSLTIWHGESRKYVRNIDSFRILATGINADKMLLHQREQTIADSLQHIAARDILQNIHHDLRMDSLNQKLQGISQTIQFLNERFDFRLIQIDSSLQMEYKVEKKIRDIKKNKEE